MDSKALNHWTVMALNIMKPIMTFELSNSLYKDRITTLPDCSARQRMIIKIFGKYTAIVFLHSRVRATVRELLKSTGKRSTVNNDLNNNKFSFD